jgi:Rrf2 family protein
MAANSRFAVAVHVVTYLAHQRAMAGTPPLPSGVIATSVDTHPVVIRRVLSALARAGIVESRNGKGGGARLARKPEKITLLDIYRSTEDCELFAARPSRAKSSSRRCAVACRMESLLDPVFDTAQKAAEASLGKITIAQLLKKM